MANRAQINSVSGLTVKQGNDKCAHEENLIEDGIWCHGVKLNGLGLVDEWMGQVRTATRCGTPVVVKRGRGLPLGVESLCNVHWVLESVGLLMAATAGHASPHRRCKDGFSSLRSTTAAPNLPGS